jgi:hypothetical protein
MLKLFLYYIIYKYFAICINTFKREFVATLVLLFTNFHDYRFSTIGSMIVYHHILPLEFWSVHGLKIWEMEKCFNIISM